MLIVFVLTVKLFVVVDPLTVKSPLLIVFVLTAKLFIIVFPLTANPPIPTITVFPLIVTVSANDDNFVFVLGFN